MFYEIPSDRTGMSAAALRGVALSARKSYRDALRSDEPPSTEEALAYRKQFEAIDVEAENEAEIEAAEVAEKAAADKAADEAAAAEQAEASDDPDDPDDPDPEPEASTTTPPVVHTAVELSAAETQPEPEGPIKPDLIISAASSSGVTVNEPFRSWGDFGMSALELAKNLSPDTAEKFTLGWINGNYPAERQLGDSAFDNLRKLDTLSIYSRSVEEITASVCAPPTPYYNLACMNTTRRPVAASLPGFQAPRGNVSIYPSPSLADVAGSAGIWTQANDANREATKNACARITCATPVNFGMYGVYWCFTAKNMEVLTFPELIAAYLNRGAANFARLGEIQLLDAMGSGVGSVTTLDLGAFSATGRIITQLLQYLALYREQQRWDDVPFQAWAPRWLQAALQVDLSRRRNTDGAFVVASTATVDAAFRDAGFDITWYLDTPTWATPVPPLTNNANLSAGATGILSPFPTTGEILVAPTGKFTMIDRAQVAIGVTGNNWYRDNASNAKNEVTYFFENYEGVVDTTSCPAHLLKFTGLCFNGVQVADNWANCDGSVNLLPFYIPGPT